MWLSTYYIRMPTMYHKFVPGSSQNLAMKVNWYSYVCVSEQAHAVGQMTCELL